VPDAVVHQDGGHLGHAAGSAAVRAERSAPAPHPTPARHSHWPVLCPAGAGARPA